MSQRLNEYFIRETSEYLEHLEQLLGTTGSPDAETLLQLARGVRGSARMAGADTIAGVAERLEDAARSVLSGNVIWSEEIRRLGMQTVQDLQVLINALNRWGPDEEARVRAAMDRWAELEDADDAGEPPPLLIADLFYDDAGPHILSQPRTSESAASAATSAGGEIVPVQALLFSGAAALREALRLRPGMEALAREPTMGVDALDEGLREIFDLVELGLDSGAAP